jgi:hypothetical protein
VVHPSERLARFHVDVALGGAQRSTPGDDLTAML